MRTESHLRVVHPPRATLSMVFPFFRVHSRSRAVHLERLSHSNARPRLWRHRLEQQRGRGLIRDVTDGRWRHGGSTGRWQQRFFFSLLFFFLLSDSLLFLDDRWAAAGGLLCFLLFFLLEFSFQLFWLAEPTPAPPSSHQRNPFGMQMSSLSLSLSLSGRYSWSPRLRAPFSFHWIPFAADFIINGARLTLTTVHYLKNHSVRSKLGEILGEKNPKLCIAFHPRDPIGSWFFLLLLPASVCVCVCVCVSFSGVLDMQMR